MIWMALAAGVIGAGITWLAVGATRSPSITPAQPSSHTPQMSEAPPSVGHLPPADAAVLLGNWHYDRQRWFQAIEQYEGALRLGKDNADVRTDLGNCYRFIKQPEKALEQYQTSQRMQPNHENSLFNQAALYGEDLNKPDRAIAVLNEFLSRFPSSSIAPRAQQLVAEFSTKQQAQAEDVKKTLEAVIQN